MNKSYLLIENKRNAYFIILGAFFISLFSLLLLYPISQWIFSHYFVSRKYIDGKKLIYKGKLGTLFIITYIGLACVIACVVVIELVLKHTGLIESVPHQLLNAIPGLLGSFFIKVQINKYNQKSTHFDGKEGKGSGFKFHIFLFLGKYALTKIIEVVSIWLLYPITSRLSTLYDYRRGYIDNCYFSYNFSLKKTYPRYLVDVLLLIVTLGFYFPLLIIRRMSSDQEFVHFLNKNETI